MYENFIKNQVFVAMKYDGMDELFSTIQSVGKKLNLDVKRADMGIGSVILTDYIIQLIEESEFIIVDLTYESPNVYFELGYAYGAGNEAHDVLLIANEASKGKIPFDIGNRTIVFYENYVDLHNKLILALDSLIKYTRQLY